MGKWETEKAIITEKEFDYDLHCFEVYNKENNTTRTLYPDNVEEMKEYIIEALNNGECPIKDNWDYND